MYVLYEYGFQNLKKDTKNQSINPGICEYVLRFIAEEDSKI